MPINWSVGNHIEYLNESRLSDNVAVSRTIYMSHEIAVYKNTSSKVKMSFYSIW